MDNIQHGKPSGYTRHGCRDNCPSPVTCRQAQSAYKRELRHRKLGWGDVDEVAVQRAVSGDRTVPLNPAEMLAAFQELDRRGHTAGRIAELLGVSARSIHRWRGGYGARSWRAAA
jgi:hypothetical protein